MKKMVGTLEARGREEEEGEVGQGEKGDTPTLSTGD